MTRWQVGWALAGGLVAAAGLWSAGVAAEERPASAPAGGAGEKVSIRAQFKEDMALRYQIKLSGAAAWTPAMEGVEWGKMETDFTFALRAKALREEGACTFELLGERLASKGDGPRGTLEVVGDREQFKVQAGGKWKLEPERNPLTREMTMTFGPLWGFRFGTGLAPMAVYFLPHVDPRFWAVLTLAPPNEVAPGDAWQEQFQLPVPGAQGEPLELTGAWEVVGWQSYRGRKVLAIALEAELSLKDSDLLLRNGDRVHVTSGSYKAQGKVLWDVERGVLCSATAEQKILVKADKPSPRALRSEHRCSLQLLAAK